MLRYADLELDEDAHEVRRAGRLIDLSPTEFNLTEGSTDRRLIAVPDVQGGVAVVCLSLSEVADSATHIG